MRLGRAMRRLAGESSRAVASIDDAFTVVDMRKTCCGATQLGARDCCHPENLWDAILEESVLVRAEVNAALEIFLPAR